MKTQRTAKGWKGARCALQTGHAGACLPVRTAVRDLILGECPKTQPATKMIFDRDMMGMQILRVVPA